MSGQRFSYFFFPLLPEDTHDVTWYAREVSCMQGFRAGGRVGGESRSRRWWFSQLTDTRRPMISQKGDLGVEMALPMCYSSLDHHLPTIHRNILVRMRAVSVPDPSRWYGWHLCFPLFPFVSPFSYSRSPLPDPIWVICCMHM